VYFSCIFLFLSSFFELFDFIVLLHSPISNLLTTISAAGSILPNCTETAAKPNHSVHRFSRYFYLSFIFIFIVLAA